MYKVAENTLRYNREATCFNEALRLCCGTITGIQGMCFIYTDCFRLISLEMLLQCDKEGGPIFLPALPKEWDKGCVKDLCLYGNRKISFAWEDGKVVWSKVTKRKDNR